MTHIVYIREIEPDSWLHWSARKNSSCLRDYRRTPPTEIRSFSSQEVESFVQKVGNHVEVTKQKPTTDDVYWSELIALKNQKSGLVSAGLRVAQQTKRERKSGAGARRLQKTDGSKALHELGEPLNQLTFMKEQCERLLELLDVELERTYAAAPHRVKSYELERSEKRNPRVREQLF